MLDALIEKHQSKNIQYLLSNAEGMVIQSVNTIFKVNPGDDLAELHPFFHVIPATYSTQEKEVYYNCVHLDIRGATLIADLQMSRSEGGLFIVIYDLTGHYQNYQKLTQSRNESVIAKELVALKNRELQERERFKDQFIRNFSHEIRNPLTSIISMTNVLGNTALNGEQRRMVSFIKDSNSSLQLLLEDILSLSMIAEGKLVIREKTFLLSGLIDLLEFTYTEKARKQGLEFTAEIDNKLPGYLEGDRLRIYQVLTNLLDNAFRYTDTGAVILRVNQNQKWANTVNIRIEVEDTGKGIPEERQEEVFQSFTRLDPLKNRGSGLGLAIVKNLLALMGSTIKLNSTPGKGSIFYFDLSLKFPLGHQTKPISSKPPESGKPSGKKHKILLVEDDERVQTAIFKSLNDTGRFYINLLNDGGLVIQELMSEQYDLVLMDVDLPNSTGDQLTSIIRDLPFPKIKNIPVVGLTANAFEDTIERCLHSGMQAVVTKPYAESELLRIIATQLS